MVESEKARIIEEETLRMETRERRHLTTFAAIAFSLALLWAAVHAHEISEWIFQLRGFPSR